MSIDIFGLDVSRLQVCVGIMPETRFRTSVVSHFIILSETRRVGRKKKGK